MIIYDSIIIAGPAIPPNRGLRAFQSATQTLSSRLIIDILKLAPEEQFCVQNNENTRKFCLLIITNIYSNSL